jgi:class 3 adenylate cyclase
MGSEVKFEFTVIGEVVNLAARLESAATPGHVLVERSQFERLVEPGDLVSTRSIRVKGIGAEVDVMELRPQ